MEILITGADRPLGRRAAEHLGPRHGLRPVGRSPAEEAGAGPDYTRADLRSPEQVEPLVRGADAVLHLTEFDPAPLSGSNAEQRLLERATLGAYTLCVEAREAGVERVVVAGSLRIFDSYPSSCLIDEQWRPRPDANARSLAPYLAELAVREFAREGPLCGVCLRFLPIGEDPERNTRPEDALAALDRALDLELGPPGYRWHVFHVARSGRFITRQARLILGFDPGS
ncbi:MAG: NAD-dependent epimerase/dehydratase family protein [Planctomycetota bacterium]